MNPVLSPSSASVRPRPLPLAATLALVLWLPGCLIPYPTYERSKGSRDNLSDAKDFSFVTVNRTTRAQVMLRLGEPDGLRDESGQQVFYRSTHNLINFVAGSDRNAVAGTFMQSNNYFLIEYDARGVVKRFSARSAPDWMFVTDSQA